MSFWTVAALLGLWEHSLHLCKLPILSTLTGHPLCLIVQSPIPAISVCWSATVVTSFSLLFYCQWGCGSQLYSLSVLISSLSRISWNCSPSSFSDEKVEIMLRNDFPIFLPFTSSYISQLPVTSLDWLMIMTMILLSHLAGRSSHTHFSPLYFY